MAKEPIGPFTVLEEVASRAFTVTYRAEQPALGRTVLLRALKPSVSPSSPFAVDLEREAQVIARLDHPGIVRLFELVQSDEASYLVLEDKRGVMLPDLLARGTLGFDAAAAVTLGLARALGHAHERGVVHRDLRPAIVELGHDGTPRIVELSAAQSARMGSLPEPLELGDALARPDFMAPEQILGEPAGPRADVFSLGAIFQWLLTSASPFAADDAKEVAHRVRTAAPAHVADLPRPFERVLALCLAKDPADRFADGNVAAAALEAALEARGAAPPAVLVTRALAAAKLGVELPEPATPARAATAPREGRGGPSVRLAARTLPVIFALVVAGAVALETARDPEAAPAAAGQAAPWGGDPQERGYLRVVASPWADLWIDGEKVDTTPIGHPVAVRPGRHFVTLRHPAAPDEQRSIKVLPGQTVLLDVAMRVSRPTVDAGTRDVNATP